MWTPAYQYVPCVELHLYVITGLFFMNKSMLIVEVLEIETYL